MSAQRHAGERHPDAAALAEYRAGLAGGLRGRRLAAHVASCARCASVGDQLAAVSSTLASAPTPPLPDAVGRRITAALAAEAALRAEAAPTAAVVPETAAPEAGPTEAGVGPRPPRSPRRARGGRWLRPAVLVSVAAACVVLFGGLYVSNVVHFTARSPSSAAASGSEASPHSGAAAAPVPGAGNANKPFAGRVAGSAVKFAVTASGMRYEPATLAAQVRAELTAKSAGRTSPSPASAGMGSPNTSGAAPSASLSACVLNLTGHMRPSLVDRATYAGKPAYVIAVPDHVWVVGRDCTAVDPHLITSIRL
jgi:hypothetical protein